MGIGPYPSDEDNRLTRALQRALIDKTREDVGVKWHPLNAVLTTIPTRPSDNGHPKSGAVRDAARDLINTAIDEIGGVKFEISPAAQSNATQAAHQHYAVGDLHRALSDADPSVGSVVVGIDVDYYLRDPSEFLGHGAPAIFHTFNPVDVSGMDGDSAFRISDDRVQYDVSGGAQWSHAIWDWCRYGEFVESPMKEGWIGTILKCVGVQKYIYHKVAHSRPWDNCPQRVLVWCLPTFSCWKINWIKSDLHARKLERVVYADRKRKGWNSLVSQHDSGQLYISIGRAGEDYSVKILKDHYDVLMSLSSAQSVTSRMLGMQYKDPALMALVGQYYTGKDSMPQQHDRIGRPMKPRVHWPAAMQAEEPETSARVYSSPLVSDENLVPMIKRWETLSTSLERRVEWVRNRTVPNNRMTMFANEFVKLVVPEVAEGIPYTLEETAALLDKPTQVLAVKQIWETVDMEARKLIEAFVKNEPCMKSGRIISSYPDMRFLLKFSTFTLAFRDKILHAEHNKHWFCPGSTPEQIAARVTEYCQEVDTPIEGDYSNFDGTVSQWCQRFVMNAVYHRYFARQYKSELTTYTDMLISCPARAKRFNFRYDAGVGVKSGSPTTCDLNTVLNAFIQYVAVRTTRSDVEPTVAFRSIGLAFGDDSLFDKQYQGNFVKAAIKLGMNLKVETYAPEKGITFLARVFPDPMTTNTSFQDPLRTWRKLHLTFRDPTIRLSSAAVDRVQGYLVTDKYTPVTSQFCNMIVRYYCEIAEGAEKAENECTRSNRKSSSREKPYWLTTGGAWPQAEQDEELMMKVISARTGFEEEKLRELCQTLNTLTDPWAPFTLNRDEEPTPLVDTLDIDAQPAEGRVDDRIFQNDKNVNNLRAGEGVPGTIREPDSQTEWTVVSRRKHGPERPERLKIFPGVSRGSTHKSVSCDRQSAGKTARGGVPQRGATRPGPGRYRNETKETHGRIGANPAGDKIRRNQVSQRGGVESGRGRPRGLSRGKAHTKI
jgi:hypothetical protein